MKNKIIETIDDLKTPIDSYSFEDLGLSCGKKYVKERLKFFIVNLWILQCMMIDLTISSL
ncbi:hypothetical protein [Hydrogenimonas thermophila]|uniref:hypothetical protein n=1 Tax=Hydrogenimonas thermophila TaxID=223786 RepID=UPI0029371590|nr:hypothetical protein [Hydrogenimonas thermophila]WOE70361.1 hypothetical protein RZR91_02030 [Hydrogenimonas thermophila]